MRYHLILKNMSVLNASAYNNYYVMGMPALTSFNGFTDKLKRVIESITNKSIVSTSYSIITHDYKFNNSKEKHVKYMNIEGSKFDKPPSNKDEFKCNFVTSMLINIDFEDNDDLDFDLDESDFSLFSFEDNIQEALYTLRVAGGEIENTNSFLSIVNNDENLLRELKKLDRGFFISDAQDKLDEYTELFDGDVLRAIIHMSALFEKEDTSSEKYEAKGWERAGEGWLTPTSIGYVQINSQPIEGNEGARDIHPLYYVEPLTSMVEYIYLNRILRKVTDDVMSSLIENKVVFTSVFEDNTYKIISKGE